MKKIILILLFSAAMFSSSSYAEWMGVTGNKAAIFSVDFERIRKNDGYVYFWEMTDYFKPTLQGHLSVKTYKQGDCKLFRFKGLSWSFHKEPFGEDLDYTHNVPDKDWRYPSPNSSAEEILKQVCNR